MEFRDSYAEATGYRSDDEGIYGMEKPMRAYMRRKLRKHILSKWAYVANLAGPGRLYAGGSGREVSVLARICIQGTAAQMIDLLEDATLAHLAVGLGGGKIKIGSMARSSRLAQYNQLLRIDEQIRGVFRTNGGE